MEEINMNENNSYKKIKKNNSLLPNIRYNNTSQKEIENNYLNEINNSNTNANYTEFKSNNRINNNNNEPYTPYNNSYTLRKYNSQMNLFNNYNENNNINCNQDEEDFSNFFGKIKIYNFYSSAEIIILIENILNELNFKKNYSFTIKDSLITFSFGNANKALEVFKRLNMEKLNNKYYRNLMIDINLDIKNNNNNKIKLPDKITEELKEENEKMLYKKISPPKKILKKLNNFKSYTISKDNLIDKNFEGIYKNYVEYFKKRKEERRKKELSYVNGKNYSLQASTPYVENDNRNYFVENLRKYKGNDISPSKFNGYIDKASIKLI